MRIVKIVLLVIAAAFVLIQFVRIDRSNPPIVAENTIEATTAVPADIQQILSRSCVDCHSNKTVYPWYTQIAPVSWWLRNHIDEGRRELNYSEFATYSARKKSKKLEEICEQVRSGEMPLPSYLIMHREAGLSDSEKDALCSWSESLRKEIAASAPPAADQGEKKPSQ